MLKMEVAILGVGLHKFGRHLGESCEHLGQEAGLAALKDAGVDYRDIQAAFCGHCNQPLGTGLHVFGELGKTGIPITNIEVACGSSSRACILAADFIAAGVYDMCMVIGVEKMPRGLVPGLIGDINDASYEHVMGLTVMAGVYAMMSSRHSHLYNTKREHFAQAAVKAHRNASLNPLATYRDVYTLEEVMNSPMIADPITLLMSSANCDGASAVILCSKKKAKQYTAKPVLLVGWAQGAPIYTQEDPGLDEGPTQILAQKAYAMAGIGPEDIDVAQVHDAFSPGEIFSVEKLGFCPEGEGGPFVWEGNTEISGKIPINTDGGLVGCGHPIGATGGRMITELTWQLRGQAGPRQVNRHKVALLQNAGLGGMNVMIFKMG